MADVYDFENAIAVAKRHDLQWFPFLAICSRTDSDLRDDKLSDSEAKSAEAALRSMTTEEGFEDRAWRELGDFLSDHLGRYDDAEQAYRRATGLNPRWARPWNSLGVLLQYDLKRYDEAELAYRRAIEIDPKFAIPWGNLGDLLRDPLKRHTEAEQAYRRSIALGPHSYLFGRLGSLLQHMGRYQEAEQAYRDALALDTRYASVWFGLGYVLSFSERYEEAEQAYRRALELEPQDVGSWNNLGNILQDHLNRNGDAEQAYRRAIELDPAPAHPWSNLGRLLARSGNRDREAAEVLLHAFELDKTRNRDLERLVRVCARLAESPSDFETALGMARKARELAPESVEAQFLLPRILASCGRWQEATPFLEQLAANESMFYSADFFRVALKTGHLNDAIAILERTGADEQWRPLYEALRAARAGTPDYLRTVAPEVRVAAAEILRDLAPALFRDAEPGPV
jgi:tetratricopeptide (TPR) repeat protein